MNEAEKEEKASFSIKLNSATDLSLNVQQTYNGGYLFLQDIYYKLGLEKICRAISSRHSFKYDLNSIMSRLIYTRILFPSFKKTGFEESKRFIEQPAFELHDIYRSLSVWKRISAYLYKNRANR